MRDKLEGVRPDTMDGVDLRKNAPVGYPSYRSGLSAASRIPHFLGWLLAVAMLVFFVWSLVDRTHAVSDHRLATERKAEADAPARTYVSSRMENVVIAEYTPAVRDAEDEYAARVRLLGKDGFEMVRRLPLSCQDGPIQARLHRVIRVRSDTWRLPGDGMETLLSEDDAEAALCGDFTGRDVPRAAGPGKED